MKRFNFEAFPNSSTMFPTDIGLKPGTQLKIRWHTAEAGQADAMLGALRPDESDGDRRRAGPGTVAPAAPRRYGPRWARLIAVQGGAAHPARLGRCRAPTAIVSPPTSQRHPAGAFQNRSTGR